MSEREFLITFNGDLSYESNEVTCENWKGRGIVIHKFFLEEL